MSSDIILLTTFQKDLKIILYECLWGNRADLSFNPSLSTDDLLSKLSDCNSYILVDDSESLFNHVRYDVSLSGLTSSNLTDGKLHIVVDNVGMDVVSDLVLATLLIHFGHIGSATFHVKQDPMYAINVTGINTHRFVSDVTTSDFEEMMSFMDKQTDPIIKQINRLWKEYLESEKWVVVSNTCWNRFEPFWELPAEILDLFKASDLVIFKGIISQADNNSTQEMQMLGEYTEIYDGRILHPPEKSRNISRTASGLRCSVRSNQRPRPV